MVPKTESVEKSNGRDWALSNEVKRQMTPLPSTGAKLGPIHFSWDHPGTRTSCFMDLFGRLSSVRATESYTVCSERFGSRILWSGRWESNKYKWPKQRPYCPLRGSIGVKLESARRRGTPALRNDSLSYKERPPAIWQHGTLSPPAYSRMTELHGRRGFGSPLGTVS